MTKQEHIKQHKRLHRALDELVADMIINTTMLPSTTSVMELMKWTFEQTKNPTNNSNNQRLK